MLGNHGATIVRWVEAGGPITVTLRTGTVLPLVRSATGRAFVAYCRQPFMKKLLERELRDSALETGQSVTAHVQELEPIIQEIRLHGIARASGSLTPGINGFSAPVFDHTGHMVAAITSLGAIGHFDTEWNSPLAISIKEAALALSIRLGHSELAAIPPSTVLATIGR
jgi:DNA-binding IclR family transcriptional regulator